LIEWKKRSAYTRSEDWLFASRWKRGRKPIQGQAVLRKHIRPVAERMGIQKQFGWHTFRHTYSTLLRSVGTEFKVMQELLRYSTLRSTLDIYTQAMSPAKHEAQAAVLSLVFASETPKHRCCDATSCRPLTRWQKRTQKGRELLFASSMVLMKVS
jgi:integrase